MGDELVLNTHRNPTYFNKEMAIGAFLVPLFGGGVISLVGGAVLGGLIGKQRIEREALAGKHIDEQHNWLNKDMLLGALIGHAIGRALVFGALAMQIATSGIGTATSLATTMAIVTPLMPAAAFMVLAASAIGAFIGNKLDERHHAAEVAQAKQQTIVRHVSRTVSPEAGQAMEYALDHQKDWSKGVLEDRMLADAQQRVH